MASCFAVNYAFNKLEFFIHRLQLTYWDSSGRKVELIIGWCRSLLYFTLVLKTGYRGTVCKSGNPIKRQLHSLFMKFDESILHVPCSHCPWCLCLPWHKRTHHSAKNRKTWETGAFWNVSKLNQELSSCAWGYLPCSFFFQVTKMRSSRRNKSWPALLSYSRNTSLITHWLIYLPNIWLWWLSWSYDL